MIDAQYTYNKLKKDIAITESWSSISGKLPQILVVANIVDDDGAEYPSPKAKVTIDATNVEKDIPASGIVMLDLSAAKDKYMNNDIVIKVYNDTQESSGQTLTIQGMTIENAMRVIDLHLASKGQTDLAKLLHYYLFKSARRERPDVPELMQQLPEQPQPWMQIPEPRKYGNIGRHSKRTNICFCF